MGRFANGSRDPTVNASAWALLTAAILSVLSRLISKYRIVHRFTSDDYLIIASVVFCSAQSVAVSIAVANGYGDRFNEISQSQFDVVMKAQYSANILYIASLYTSKLSLCLFIRNLSPKPRDHFFSNTVQIILAAWAMSTFFVTVFQCHPPRTWDYWQGSCINTAKWHYFFCSSNLVTDLSIILQALFLIVRLHAPVKKRFLFASIFLTRVLVIGAIIAELVLIQDITNLADPTYDYCFNTVAMEVVQCMSIATACWGQLKPFLNQMKSNGMRIPGAEYQSTYGKYSNSHSQRTEQTTGSGNAHDLVPIPPGQGNQTTISTSSAWDANSQSSQVGMIRETRTWVVTDSRRSDSL
ncbi:hypothetical protein P170DRAFT_193354 [Aspergillus steynii IBT 23096]|uniref:Rhodopsin domain-containing protein n=1 Tax=Aspergillus steynii IBT 23096 TaxID=1392250 RepID=A0A2I2G3L9_9EURO|nr:uncharacterized protein P170DRAFT_193354 [Aspergillus steynii IBT 23096]PLB47473.1 hypothetical protein P170DRAFT_193354 [Aspergillus steynii IBT 23096]